MIRKVKNISFEEATTSEEVHSLPCRIHHNGDANISDYFKPVESNNPEEDLCVSFRGYPLIGKRLEIPEGYHGVILEAEKTPENITQKQKFGSITYWEWDKIPTKNDPFLSTLDCLSLLAQVHEPVEEIED